MNLTEISIFKRIFDTSVPYHIALEKALERVRVGKSKEKIDRIRGGENVKDQLPAICFSGKFSQRKKNGLTNHSGLMVLDFDKYKDQKTMKQQRKIILKNKHLVALFISPSGNGLKAIIKIPKSTAEEHEKYFKSFIKEFDYPNIDTSGCNVDRVCYESYDPDIYINYECKVYNPTLEDEGFTVYEKQQLIPVTNEDDIIKRITEWNWVKDFNVGERNVFVYNLSSTFCEFGINETSAEAYFNTVYGTSKDFTAKELTNTVKNAYKSRQFNSRYFEDYQKIERVRNDLKLDNEEIKKRHHGLNDDTIEALREHKEIADFWYFELVKGKQVCRIDSLKFKYFLERTGGFNKYFPNGSHKPNFVKITSNQVEDTSPDVLKDFVLDYLLNKKSEIDVWNYAVNYSQLFSDNHLTFLNTIKLDFFRDTKDKCLLAFRNGVVEITGDKIEVKEFLDYDGYIWKEQIIDHDFEKTEINDNDYKDFIDKISNNKPDPFYSAIGYMIHTYKNKMNNKALILNDEVISDNPEGGTGKGLFVQGLKQVRKTAILDGKSFDDKKSFPYQTVSQDVNILVFDDVKKNFDFESKFSLVTEGMTLERKNKDAIKLTVEESPKLIISTNYAIKGEGNSHNRRRHELEISQFFNGELTPYDHYGRQLFDDWDLEENNRFFNFMIFCVRFYLKNGLLKQDAVNIDLRKFIAETSMEFYEWASDLENMPLDERLNKKDVFDYFVGEYQDFKKFLSRKKFIIWCKKLAKFKKIEYSEGNTNGSRWFELGKSEDIPF